MTKEKIEYHPGLPREFDHKLMNPTFGDLLARYRLETKKTQTELGHQVPLDPSHITHLELGDKPPPLKSNVAKIANALDLSEIKRSEIQTAAGYSPDCLTSWDNTYQAVADVLNDPRVPEQSRFYYRYILLTVSKISRGGRLFEDGQKFINAYSLALKEANLSEPTPDFSFEWPIKIQPTLLEVEESPTENTAQTESETTELDNQIPEPNPRYRGKRKTQNDQPQQLGLFNPFILNPKFDDIPPLIRAKSAARILKMNVHAFAVLATQRGLPTAGRNHHGNLYCKEDVFRILAEDATNTGPIDNESKVS